MKKNLLMGGLLPALVLGSCGVAGAQPAATDTLTNMEQNPGVETQAKVSTEPVTQESLQEMRRQLEEQLQQVAFYNTDTSKINKANPELAVPVSLQPGASYNFTLLIDDTVAVLYVNDQMALSTRMYALPEHQWGIFSVDSDVVLSELNSSTF